MSIPLSETKKREGKRAESKFSDESTQELIAESFIHMRQMGTQGLNEKQIGDRHESVHIVGAIPKFSQSQPASVLT